MKSTVNRTDAFAYEFCRGERHLRLEARFTGYWDQWNSCIEISFTLKELVEVKYLDGSEFEWRQINDEAAFVYSKYSGCKFMSERSINEYIHKNFPKEAQALREKIAKYVANELPQSCIE